MKMGKNLGEDVQRWYRIGHLHALTGGTLNVPGWLGAYRTNIRDVMLGFRVVMFSMI